MSYQNLDSEFSSINASNEEEDLQMEKESIQGQRHSPMKDSNKKELEELTQFFAGEDEEEEEEKEETSESGMNVNDKWEDSKESTDQREKQEMEEEAEISDSSVNELFEGDEAKDTPNTQKQEDGDEEEEEEEEEKETQEMFERGESESENEIINTKRFKKNKLKKRKLQENSESNEETENNEQKNKKIKKKKKKLMKCNFIDDAAELDKEEEVERYEEEEEEEEENFMLEGEEYRKNASDENNNLELHIKKKQTVPSQELDFSGIDNYTEDEYEADRENITKSKSKKTTFDEITDTLKLNRKKTIKITEEDALQYCEGILNQMVLLHEQDVKSMKDRKPMTAKLQAIDEVCKILTKPKWKPYFMKLDIYHALALWLMPINKNTLPNYSIRTNLLKVIQQLPITMKSLRGSQLGKVMTYLHSHKDETDDNKKLIRSIMQNWMGPIIGINTNYKYSIKQRQKKIRENPEFHKKILEKAKTLIPDSICIEKEEAQNEFKRHATIPYNSECSFLINVSSSMPDNANQNMQKSKIKRLADNLKMNKKCRKSHKVSIEGKGVAVAP